MPSLPHPCPSLEVTWECQLTFGPTWWLQWQTEQERGWQCVSLFVWSQCNTTEEMRSWKISIWHPARIWNLEQFCYIWCLHSTIYQQSTRGSVRSILRHAFDDNFRRAFRGNSGQSPSSWSGWDYEEVVRDLLCVLLLQAGSWRNLLRFRLIVSKVRTNFEDGVSWLAPKMTLPTQRKVLEIPCIFVLH